MRLTPGTKVNWTRAAQNNVEGSLTVVGIGKSGPFEFALLRSSDGRFFIQVIQPESLQVV